LSSIGLRAVGRLKFRFEADGSTGLLEAGTRAASRRLKRVSGPA
jgi:hypothetical protein